MNSLLLKFRIISNNHFKQIYRINYAVLLLTSIAYFFYIYFMSIRQHISLQGILKSSPYTAIMMIVVLLNILVGYFLWIKKDLVLSSNNYSRLFLITLSICQLMVGNILSFFASITTYLAIGRKEINPINSSTIQNKLVIGSVIFIALLYILCFYMIVVIATHS